MTIILKYFKNLSDLQISQLEKLQGLYTEWNSRINLISRKDLENFHERHVLHSLSIAKAIAFNSGTKVLDAGTGGGFPGVPLAIYFPDVTFHLVDSTKKKLFAVQEIANSLDLKNITTEHSRLEDHNGMYDFVVSRAVTGLPRFHEWTGKNIKPLGSNNIPNGTFYLKGEDLEMDFIASFHNYKVWSLSDFFGEEFFDTKKLVYYAGSGKREAVSDKREAGSGKR